MPISGTVNVVARIRDEALGATYQELSAVGVDADVVGEAGQRQTLSIASGFNAITVPSGSAAVVMRVVSGAVTLTLRGVSGDTGVVLQSAALTTFPIVLPLGTSPSLGIQSDGTATVDVMFL